MSEWPEHRDDSMKTMFQHCYDSHSLWMEQRNTEVAETLYMSCT